MFSQASILGVFSLWENQYYAINKSENLCWVFTRGTSINPNWLMPWWQTVNTDNIISQWFLTTPSCEAWKISQCCKEQWYRYAWIPIWESNIGENRISAEYLASNKYIQNNSYNPWEYKLSNFITRKELIKIIINISWTAVPDICQWIFSDVSNDWSCKYIESALQQEYIAWNQAFRPSEFITSVEAIKLIFKARNIDKRYSTESWQEDYVSTALYLWLIDEKFQSHNDSISRWDIFTIVTRTF